MPHRARRSSPTNDATDLTDEPWAAIAPLVITPSSKGGRPTEIDRRGCTRFGWMKDRGRSENRICGIMIVTMPF